MIYSGVLSVLLAVLHEASELVVAEVVPERVEHDVALAVLVVEVVRLELLLEEVRHVDCSLIVYVLCHSAPALPCKDGALVPLQFRT